MNANNNSERLATPNTARLEELVEQLEHDLEDTHVDEDGVSVTVDEVKEIVEALKWICVKVGTNKLYHKKQQLKRKLIEKLVRSHLSEDDLRNIDAQATKAAGRSFED